MLAWCCPMEWQLTYLHGLELPWEPATLVGTVQYIQYKGKAKTNHLHSYRGHPISKTTATLQNPQHKSNWPFGTKSIGWYRNMFGPIWEVSRSVNLIWCIGSRRRSTIISWHSLYNHNTWHFSSCWTRIWSFVCRWTYCFWHIQMAED